MALTPEHIEMVEFPCPVCHSTDYRVVYLDTLQGKLPSFDYNFTRDLNLTYRLVRCRQCTHQYASPRPVNIWSQYEGSRPDPIYLETARQRVETSYPVLRRLRKYKPSGRLLDVGCATGDFLSVAKNFYDVEGLELSEWSSKAAEERGFVVHRKVLSEMNQAEAYDIVTLWGVIEHFEDPEKEVQNIYRLLKKGGLVSLWTGDVGSIVARLLGKKWWYYQGQHIQMFSRNSLCALFEGNGFSKVYIGCYPYVMTMKSLRNSLSRYPALYKPLRFLLEARLISNIKFTMKLPGEMFAVFAKR
jgi:SAM-dependent methyltransferase